ncbi:putative inositol polyphosphate phosphatase [Talaromyces proteolyticus]|uniref:Inositol polyphosphate phosphatase n=1 Tax=Talaromyces proteolyticus TaxID=1131652 RepID=A0AAD4KXB3_9EURO|nr:putative inositol polyphosphate phosphatase [Talaromyces proteolyticus]KAH8702016.1 putative inositol polyphosphate phosphatase [Talaromyces proteolyticus]
MDNNRKKAEGTDDAPLRPVSSLLSHFEHLSFSGNGSTGNGAPRDNASRSKAQNWDSVQPTIRASLDIPRPAWGVSNGPRSDSPAGSANGGWNNSQHERSPGAINRSRPTSMSLQSPQLTPALTIESPRSPPPSSDLGHRGNKNWQSLGPDHSDLSPKSASWQNPHTLRSKCPGSPFGGSVGVPQLSREPSPVGKPKSTSVPPPVNRADKPKVPAKPANISHFGMGTLAPGHGKDLNDNRVSPFSTPPSSPEKPLVTESTKPKNTSHVSLSSRTIPEPLSLPPPVDRGPRTPTPTLRSYVSDSVSTNHKSGADSPGHLRSMSHFAPSTRDARELGFTSRKASQESDVPENRPTLPPRDGLRGRQTRIVRAPEFGHSDIQPRSFVDLPVRPTKPTTSNRPPAIDTSQQFAPPPRRHTAAIGGKATLDTPQTPSSHVSPLPDSKTLPSMSRPPQRQVVDDSEDEGYAEDTLIPRTDFPDSSQVNRRPPVFKDGPLSISTKYDTRVFDVCGNNVCTTGYLTRVWDLTTGEQKMSISHGETVKALSVAFKPGTGLGDEGTRLWVGTTVGELHEIDIASQTIVASRSYPSRREIIKIYRHKKEMWTLDDEGKLLIWPPDETGTPNLKYSYDQPPDRVAKGHTFSMVVGDYLWFATGKEVRIYRPNAQDDSFHVLKKPLGANHTGEVTSGAHTTKDGGRVYLGHADGKVTVYSTADYSCLSCVNVSAYKINSLAFVGDYLWAAYKTGMVYVYDISTCPWVVKKDWRAHESPVCGLVLDPSGLWTINRLQVVSLGTDNFLRLWDGMLEDDWLELRMQGRDVEYCNFREIRATIMTWNAGASVPRDLSSSSFIQEAIHPEQPPEILVFGFQELVDLENKKITAKSLLMGSKKRENNEKEHMSRQYRVWVDHLTSCINNAMPLDESYSLLHTANLVGLFTCVFIKQTERQRVRHVSGAEVKRGMGGLHGNKGALILRFILDDSSLCFVNCHLAAGQTQTAHRNNDIAAILETQSLPAENSLTARADLFVNGGDGTMILDHEICILNGDLNYRIDSMSRNAVIDAVRQNNLPKLLERDQLLASKRKNPNFRLRSFNEAPITFAPTYKYDVNSDEYDTSEKKRSPAWCDRILYRGAGRIKQSEYRRHEVRASDHRPVSASFKMRIKTVSPQDRTAAWETCQKEFTKEKKRLACDSSVEYLVKVLGMDREEARRVITSGGSK